jgi:hypothetical protein
MIEAPPAKVWEMLAADRLLEWDVGIQKRVKSVEFISEINTPEDKFSVGTSAGLTDNRGKKWLFVYEITESIETEKLVYRSDTWNVTVTNALKPVEAGTECTIEHISEVPWIFGKIIEKLFVKRMNEKVIERSLEQLKSILEK